MLQGEHSAKLSTFIKLPLVIKTFVLSLFEWRLKFLLYKVFTVLAVLLYKLNLCCFMCVCISRHFVFLPNK